MVSFAVVSLVCLFTCLCLTNKIPFEFTVYAIPLMNAFKINRLTSSFSLKCEGRTYIWVSLSVLIITIIVIASQLRSVGGNWTFAQAVPYHHSSLLKDGFENH